ncbi:uncharacterized protein [Odocoileus virginianus]|uniref:Basic proline-rich protein-like n=1 Tax=Odocoileus virginianus TaxID=9874 RepID=A0ABM4HMK0_ODOVR
MRSPARGPRCAPASPKRISGDPEGRTGGAGRAAAPGPPESRAAHPSLPGPTWHLPPPDAGRGSGMGVRPRGRAPRPHGALGAEHPTAGAPARPGSRGPTPAAAGPRRQKTRRRAPPGRPLGPPPGPTRPPLTWRRAGGAGARRLLAGTRSPRAQSRASRRPPPPPSARAPTSRRTTSPPHRPPPARPPGSPASDTASGIGVGARHAAPPTARAAPPIRRARARQRPAHSRHHPPRADAPPRPRPPEAPPPSPPALSEPAVPVTAGAARAAWWRQQSPDVESREHPQSPRRLSAGSSAGGQAPVCNPHPYSSVGLPNLNAPHLPGPLVFEIH